MRGKEQFLEYFFQRSSTLFPFFFFLYFKYSSIRQQMYSFLYFFDSRQQKRRLSNGFNIENDFVLKNGNRSPNFSLRKAADNDNSGEKIIVLSQLLFVTVYFLLLKMALHSSWTDHNFHRFSAHTSYCPLHELIWFMTFTYYYEIMMISLQIFLPHIIRRYVTFFRSILCSFSFSCLFSFLFRNCQ